MNLEDIISGWNGCSGSGGDSDPYAAYDVIFRVSTNAALGGETAEVIKGDFDNCIEKAYNAQLVSAKVYAYGYYEENGEKTDYWVKDLLVTQTFCGLYGEELITVEFINSSLRNSDASPYTLNSNQVGDDDHRSFVIEWRGGSTASIYNAWL